MKMPTEPQHHDPEDEYSLRPEDVLTKLDPELQNAILERSEGRPLPRYLCRRRAGGGEVVDVIAKLRRPNAKVEGLIVSQRIGRIVTGEVAVEDIVKVRKHRDVLSLKGARRLRRMLANSVPEIRATADQLRAALRNEPPQDFGDLDGAGVVVGIVDHGCDFAHRNFRKLVNGVPGPTRILYLWDQRGGANETSPEGWGKSPCGYDYGREFSAEALNWALTEAPPSEDDPDAPHRCLRYKIEDEHGTQVMDVAAGSGGGKFAPGVAPGADIIFVDSSLGEDAESDASLGNSRRILEAVKYVFDKASEWKRPAVVNISLNYDGGPHDGTTPVEEAFDLLLETPGRAIVIAAGNSRVVSGAPGEPPVVGIHAEREAHPNQACMLFWKVRQGDQTENKLEVWYGGRHRLELRLQPPGGAPLGPVRPGSTFTLLRGREKAGRIFNRVHDSSNGDNHIVVLLDAGAQHGVWELELRPIGGRSVAPFAVHAWIESDPNTSVFNDARPEDKAYTLGTLACGHSTIVVTGYDALEPRFVPEIFAEGPTRDGKQKPEVSAPGASLSVARKLIDTVSPAEGTSLAAPHVTGLIALLMQAARGMLTIEQTRDFVIGGARRNPPAPHNVWDSRYGAGRIDASASALACLRSQQPAVVLMEEGHELIITETVVSFLAGGAVALAAETRIVSAIAAAPLEVSHESAPAAVEDNGPAGAEPGEVDAPAAPPETEGH